MGEYAIRRVLLFIPTLLMATVLVFTLFWIVPGDPALTILVGGEGDSGSVSQEQLQQLRLALGLTSAVKQDTGFDYLSRIFSGIGIALPTFWLGILIVYALASFFQWLPPLGYATLWDDPLLNLQQLIFPALTLAFHDLAFTARVTRSSMLEVMREDYLRTARAKGLMEILVIGRHALKNALLPVVTVSGYQFARLLGGVIIVESIFVVPGMGTLLIDSIVHRDFIVIQAVVLLIAAVVLVLNLVIDLLYGVLDP